MTYTTGHCHAALRAPRFPCAYLGFTVLRRTALKEIIEFDLRKQSMNRRCKY